MSARSSKLHRHFKKKPANSLLALLAAVPALPLVATATTYNWTGTTNGTWAPATIANWNGVAVTHDNNADVVFGSTPPIVTYTTYLGDGPRTVRSISVNALTSPLEIRTNNNGGTGRTLHFSSSAGNAQLNIASGVAQTVHIGTGTGTNVNGSVNLVSDLTIDHQGSALLTISRPINETVAGRSITKTGTGTLLLSGANTFTGNVTISGGIVQLGTATGLGTTAGDTFVQSGGTLDFNGQLLGAGETVSIAGAGQGGIGALYQATVNTSGANSIGDHLILTGDATIGAGGNSRFGIGANGTSTTTGLYTLTKVGTGQFDLRGQVTIGNIVVNEGALQTEGVATYNNDGYSLTVNNGAAFRAYEIVNPFTRNIFLNGSKIISNGTLPAGNLYTGNVTLTGASGIENNGGDGDLMIFPGNFSEAASGASLTITGTRRVVLSGTNSYTGPTNVTSGIFEAAGSFTSDIAVTGTATLDGEGSTTGTISLADGTALVFDPRTTGPDQFLRAADVIIPSSGLIAVNVKAAAGGTGIVVLHDANGGLNLSNFELQNPGRASLSLGGAGGNSDLLYNFPAANLEWRAFTNSDWTTEDLNHNFQNLATNLPEDFYARDNVDFTDAATGTVTVLAPVTPGHVVFKNTVGHDLTFATLGFGSIDATSLTTTPTTGNVTFEAPLVGVSPLTHNSASTITLAGANTSTGTITVNAGTLQLGDGINTTSLTAPVVNNAAFVANVAGSATLGSPISGTGTFTKTGTGTVILNAENTYTGLTKVDSGILQIGNGANGWVAGDIETNASVDFSRSTAALTYAGTISGTGIVAKRNSGTLTLTGTNTFAGGVQFYNGTLIASDANLGSGPLVFGPSGTNANTLSIAGGTIDNDIYFNNTGTGNKIINLAPGFLDATLSGTIHLDADTGTGAGVSRISPVLSTIVVSGKLTGAGLAGYSKRSSGTVVLTNPTNDYTGPTSIVDGGTLLVDGRVPGNLYFGDGLGAGGVSAFGGTLGGSGTIGGNVKLETNSKLSPGGSSASGVNTDTRATLTISGNLEAANIASGNGRIYFQLGAPAGPNDRVDIGGALNIGSNTIGLNELVVTDAGGLAAGTYTLLHAAGGITGALDANNLTGTFGAGLNGALSISGNDVILTVTAGTAYDTWAAGYPGLTNKAFDTDFDGDGISTGLEWILGGNPTVSDAASIAPTATADATNGITLSFHRNEDSIGVATLSVEYGTTLTTFPGSVLIGSTSAGPNGNGVVVTINDVPTPDNVTVTIPATNAVNGKLYARIKATTP